MKKLKNEHERLNQQIKETKTKVAECGGNLYRAQDFKSKFEAQLNEQESKKRAACIKNRNEVSITELRQDYEASLRQIGQKPGDKPLQVFPVSALVYFDFLAGNIGQATFGFERRADTGIPPLHKWLVETTLTTRNRNALAFLEAVVSLELSMKPWIEDSSAEYKMQEDHRAALEELFEQNFEELCKVCSPIFGLTVSI